MKAASDADGLDAALHSPARIAIMSWLAAEGRARFSGLREATRLTPGNLASHLQALEGVGYVETRDAIIRKRPGKLVRITSRGEAAVDAYLDGLERLVSEVRARRTARRASAPAPGGGAAYASS